MTFYKHHVDHGSTGVLNRFSN